MTSEALARTSAVRTLIELALAEDIGAGDLTSQWFLPAALNGRVAMCAREDLVFAGGAVAAQVFRMVEASVIVENLTPDGTEVAAGTTVMTLRGPMRGLLTAERTALNFVQRLSGVATSTRRHVRELEGTPARLLDTRKTTPGYRALEKSAVAAGGGQNHRMGLFDRVLMKDNHLAALPDPAGIPALFDRIKAAHPAAQIEIEADTLEQVARFATWSGVDFILLDNMSPTEIREALSYRRPGLAFEASGGIHLGNLRVYGETGVDFISVGAMTHSARAVDLGLDYAADAGN